MRLFLDQDVYAVTAQFLKGLGHDMVSASELGMATAPDTEILLKARQDQRILVSRDNDYGHLVFVGAQGPGVIRLAITPSTVVSTHRVLAKLMDEMTEDELLVSFAVVETDRYRVRRPR